MHRLQHLRVGRLDAVAVALHAEFLLHGGMAERLASRADEARCLGAQDSGRRRGPAGLSAAHRLGLRGYEVALSETSTELGGRVARECRLPGLSAWGRVRDYRQGQIEKMPNVAVYRESKIDGG